MKDKNKELILKLAKAKTIYECLCSAVEMREEILKGHLRGSKNCWNPLDKELLRGKKFFADVKGLTDLCREMVPAEKEGDKEG